MLYWSSTVADLCAPWQIGNKSGIAKLTHLYRVSAASTDSRFSTTCASFFGSISQPVCARRSERYDHPQDSLDGFARPCYDELCVANGTLNGTLGGFWGDLVAI